MRRGLPYVDESAIELCAAEDFVGHGALIRVVGIAVFCLGAGAATAADLAESYAASECLVSSQSSILELGRSELVDALASYREEADRLARDPAIIGSNTPAFDWAVAASLQCTIALGSLKGGNVDEVSSQKCDCFHSRMLSTL